ncbi:MAG TPA: hypothetical protein VK166_13745 [Chitinophagaceae bacterium]|nr:hypothetical protein [Chitinophagaceae bacterium]
MKISRTFKNILILGVLVGLIVGGWAVWYVFYKPHRDVSAEKPKFELTSTALTESFKSDTAALTKYVDQAVLVEGAVTGVEGNHVSLGNIICSMDSTNLAKLGSVKTGDQVKIQGRLTSYNDLMEEVMLDNCVFK